VSWAIFGAITLLIAVLGLLVLRNRPADKGLRPIGAEDQADQPHSATTGIRWSQVYRAPTVWHLGLVYVAFGFSYIIYMTFFTKALVTEGGYTEEAAGNLFMILGWCSLFCGLIWGTASDRIGRKKALIMVYLTHAIAFSLFALWPVSAGYTISAVLFGLSAWSIPAIMAATCGDVLGPRLASAALGFITLFFGIGQAVAPSIAGAMADATDSFAPAFLLAGGVALLGALGALLFRPTPTPVAD
jgi:sugar phosphate permease